MKKLLLVTLLTIFSTSVMADWKPFGGSDTLDLYIDNSSKRKVGNKVKMWVMQDLKVPGELPEGKKYLSIIAQEEFDCANETTRVLQLNYYSENMQKGTNVQSDSFSAGESRVMPVTPNTLQETSWNVACRKK